MNITTLEAALKSEIKNGVLSFSEVHIDSNLFDQLLHSLPIDHQLVLNNTTISYEDEQHAVRVKGTTSMGGVSGIDVSTTFTAEDGDGALRCQLQTQFPQDGMVALPGISAFQFAHPGMTLEISSRGDVSGSFQGDLNITGLTIPVCIHLPIDSGDWHIKGSFEAITLPDFASLAKLAQTPALSVALPQTLSALDKLSLSAFELDLDKASGAINTLRVGVKVQQGWPIVAPQLILQDVELAIQVDQPANKKARDWSGEITGSLIIDTVPLPLKAIRNAQQLSWQFLLDASDPVSLKGVASLLNSLGKNVGLLPPGMDALSQVAVNQFDMLYHDELGIDKLALGIAINETWRIDALPAFNFSNIQLDLTLVHPGDKQKRNIHGKISGELAIADANFQLQAEKADADADWAFSTALIEDSVLDPAAVVSALSANKVSLPRIIGQLSLREISLSFTPESGEFSLQAQSAQPWTFPPTAEYFSVNQLTLAFSQSAADAEQQRSYSGSLTLQGNGSAIIDGLALQSYNFSFLLENSSHWQLSGELQLALLDSVMQLSASYEEDSASQTNTFNFAWQTAQTQALVSAEGIFALEINKLALQVVQTEQLTELSLEGTNHFAIADIIKSDCTLALGGSKQAQSLSLEFDKAEIPFALPLVPGKREWDIQIVTAMQTMLLARDEKSWRFSAQGELRFNNLPTALTAFLPQQIDASVDVDKNGVSLSVKNLLNKVSYELPRVTIGALDFSLGELSLSMDLLTINLSKKPGASGDFTLGLPEQLNNLFGTDQGKPKLKLFNPELSFDLGIKAGTGLSLKMLTPPLNIGKLKEEAGEAWLHLDLNIPGLGDFGEVRFVQPEFNFSGSAFKAKGEFEMVRRLALPLGFVKSLLQNAGLDGLAEVMPAQLPLTEFKVLKNNELDVDQFVKELKAIDAGGALDTALDGVAEALKLVASRVNELPEDFRQYLELVIPKQLAFDIEATPGSGLGLKVDISTSDTQPIKLLMPGSNGFTGIKLRKLAIGETFGGALVMVEADAVIDSFDIPTLVAVMLLPTEQISLLPDPTTLHRRFVAKDLFAVIPTAAPVPIPLFFDDLGVEFLGLEGLGGGLKFQFALPDGIELFNIINTLRDMWPFFADKDYALPDDFFDQHDLGLSFGIDPAFFALPKYTGGAQLGKRGEVFKVSLSKALADALNTIKNPRLGRIVRLIPVESRVGEDDISFGPMKFIAAWVITTDKEYSEALDGQPQAAKIIQQLESIPAEERKDVLEVIKFDSSSKAGAGDDGAIILTLGAWKIDKLVNFNVRMGMAQSLSLGYGFGFGIKGDIASFMQFEAQGSLVVNLSNKSNPVYLLGSSYLILARHQIFRGDIQLQGDRFILDGELALFPQDSPVQMNGKGLVDISGDGQVKLASDIEVSLANFELLGSTILLSNEQIIVRGTWLGVSAGFEAILRQGEMLMKGDVGFDLTISLDLGPIKEPITGLKLVDKITLGRTGLAAILATELGQQVGFHAYATSSFHWDGKKLEVPGFDISIPPLSIELLINEFIQAIEAAAYEIFKAILGEAEAWLNAVKSGLVELQEDVVYIGKVLDQGFKKTGDEAAKLLKDAEYTAEEVGKALEGAYKFSAEQVAIAMQKAGYAANEVAKALESAYNYSAKQVALALRQAGYAAEEVGKALQSAFNYSAKQVAIAMRDAGYAAEEVSKALKSAYNFSAKQAAEALKQAGYAANEVGKAMKSVYRYSAKQAAKVMKAVGYSANQVAGTMKNVYKASAKEVAKTVKSVYKLGDNATKGVLRAAGYAGSAIDGAMKSVFGWGKKIFKKIKFW